MMTIYIDANNKCHISNDGNMTAFETDYFDGKCPAYIEGYCCEITENSVAYYPWRDLTLLEEFQAQYEAQLEAADAAYQEGVNTAYD